MAPKQLPKRRSKTADNERFKRRNNRENRKGEFPYMKMRRKKVNKSPSISKKLDEVLQGQKRLLEEELKIENEELKIDKDVEEEKQDGKTAITELEKLESIEK